MNSPDPLHIREHLHMWLRKAMADLCLGSPMPWNVYEHLMQEGRFEKIAKGYVLSLLDMEKLKEETKFTKPE